MRALRISAVVGLLGWATLASADVAPGDTVSKANIDKVKGLVSPAVEWCINQGMTLKIIAPKPIGWPSALQGRHREVRESGEARRERSLALGLRRRLALSEDRFRRSEDRREGHVELRVPARIPAPTTSSSTTSPPTPARSATASRWRSSATTGSASRGASITTGGCTWIRSPSSRIPRASASRRCSVRSSRPSI